MAQQHLNSGTIANDGTGDTLRAASQKIEANFTELYASVAANTADIVGKLSSSAIDTDTTMAANSDTKVASQKATKAAIAAAIAGLVNSSPSALDTLKELADALGDDANFAATVTAALAGKIATSAIDVDATFAANSDSKIASQKAVKAALGGGGAWNASTPVPTAGSGTFTTVSCAVRWIQIGKTIHLSYDLTITANGTAAGFIKIPLPVAARAAYAVGPAREINVTGAFVQGYLGATTDIWIVNSSNAYPGGTGYRLVGSITYEAA